MSRILNRRPSPAMVVALIALFVAMGGVSYGVATGSIDGREIKNSTIKTGDLRNNEIRGTDIRRGTITGSDVGSNALSGADISESSLGKVASASRADSATTANSAGTANTANSANTANTANTANSANTVNGLRTEKFFFKGAAPTGIAPRYSSNGFVLNAGCNAGGAPAGHDERDGRQRQEPCRRRAPTRSTARTLNNDFANVNVIGAQHQWAPVRSSTH